MLDLTPTTHFDLPLTKTELRWVCTAEKFNERLMQPGVVGLNVQRDGELVGFALLAPWQETLFLWELVIRHDRQGQGLGGEVLEALKAYGRTLPGAKVMTVTYTRGNQRAEVLYRHHGFTQTDVVDTPTVHEVNMRCALG
ncbi:GNAT family N-acetyltransferase [Lacticaseibacillus yichunensis]|uniref:GNAT family N-acetyltransferase n=1 Tax=Lacticaseibacillus yichunensis TaxID=2486015 RepID=A0ABW4CQT8_9LACO|nr:GNAT family N-acetyltransferase [Lacticaseibacillus yichunensis]